MTDISCLWWKLPKSLTNLVKPTGKTSLKFTAYKTDGNWYFDKPELLTWKELLVFTEAMDELAEGDSKLKMTLSSIPIEGAHTAWYHQDDPFDVTASHYYWGDHLIWLCGWLPWYFDGKPETLYFTTEKV